MNPDTRPDISLLPRKPGTVTGRPRTPDLKTGFSDLNLGIPDLNLTYKTY